MEKKTEMNKKAYLFHVEVLVEGYNKAMAQEALLALLRSEKVKTVQIQSATQTDIRPNEEEVQKRKKRETSKNSEVKPSEMKRQETKLGSNAGYQHIINQIEDFKVNNTLIRLSIVKGKGIKLSVPCRVLNYDDITQNVTIYHVDEKQVYQYSLNEIDELTIG
jgi:hypothetical protein